MQQAQEATRSVGSAWGCWAYHKPHRTLLKRDVHGGERLWSFWGQAMLAPTCGPNLMPRAAGVVADWDAAWQIASPAPAALQQLRSSLCVHAPSRVIEAVACAAGTSPCTVLSFRTHRAVYYTAHASMHVRPPSLWVPDMAHCRTMRQCAASCCRWGSSGRAKSGQEVCGKCMSSHGQGCKGLPACHWCAACLHTQYQPIHRCV